MGFEEDVRKFNFKSVILGSILGALGLLVAFAWKDFIQNVINLFFPMSTANLFYQFAATMSMTLIAVSMGYFLVRISEKSFIETFKRRKYEVVTRKIKVKAI